jgi:cytochrome c biogenesis protein CcmG/thiol:disulfide interchange protein DsbE
MNWRRAAAGCAVAAAVVALLAFGLTRDPSHIPSPLPGKPAPEFALQVLDAQDSIRLADLRGQVVVLNFWASWCLACRDEHDDLVEIARRYAGRGVRVLGVVYNDFSAPAVQWIRDMGGANYPSLMDERTRVAIDYGVAKVPETFVIDRTGTVVLKHFGPIEATRLAAVIEPLLVEGAAQRAPLQ